MTAEQKIKFEEKVKSLTAKEMILTMVKALRDPWVELDMGTYGGWKFKGLRKVCVGCAATNTVCELAGFKFTPSNIDFTEIRAKKVGCDISFLNTFEMAIDDLRCGNIEDYNESAEMLDMAQIPLLPGVEALPEIDNEDLVDGRVPEEILVQYENYANRLN